MSNSLDPDQARHFVGPGLGPSCLQRLSVEKGYLVNFEVDTWHSLLHEPPKVKSTCYVYIFKPLHDNSLGINCYPYLYI